MKITATRSRKIRIPHASRDKPPPKPARPTGQAKAKYSHLSNLALWGKGIYKSILNIAKYNGCGYLQAQKY